MALASHTESVLLWLPLEAVLHRRKAIIVASVLSGTFASNRVAFCDRDRRICDVSHPCVCRRLERFSRDLIGLVDGLVRPISPTTVRTIDQVVRTLALKCFVILRCRLRGMPNSLVMTFSSSPVFLTDASFGVAVEFSHLVLYALFSRKKATSRPDVSIVVDDVLSDHFFTFGAVNLTLEFS